MGQLGQIKWWQPEIGLEEEKLVLEVIRSNYLNDGEFTSRFEREVAERVGVPYAVAVTSGTTALYLSLMALGIGHGDEVIVPDVTFIATANAVTMTGAKPILVDISTDTLTIDPGAFEKAISQNTKAVVPVHVSGRGGSLLEVIEIAKSHNLYVIEDAAEALMSNFCGRYLGSYGATGCFSFSPNKTITTGQGGAIVTSDPTIYKRLRELKDQGRPTQGTGGDDTHNSIGFNFKLTNLQAAIGLGQLSRLSDRLDRQKKINVLYREELRTSNEIKLLPFNTEGGEVPQWTDVLADRRDHLVHYLSERGINCRKFWLPIHQQRPYLVNNIHFPNSTMLMSKALWLPSSFLLTDDDIKSVCSLIKDFYRL